MRAKVASRNSYQDAIVHRCGVWCPARLTSAPRARSRGARVGKSKSSLVSCTAAQQLTGSVSARVSCDASVPGRRAAQRLDALRSLYRTLDRVPPCPG